MMRLQRGKDTEKEVVDTRGEPHFRWLIARRQWVWWILAMLALVLLLSFYIIRFKGLLDSDQYRQSLKQFITQTSFQTGDLIFRRGSSFESLMVLSMDRESQYSHVGVIVMADNAVWVVHTEPGERNSRLEIVRKEPLEIFLAPDRATQYAMYRLSDHHKLNIGVLTHWLDSIYQSAVPFDYKFDDTDSTRLYCSELVWKGYSAAGISLLLEKNSPMILFGMKLSVILPSTLLGQQPFYKVGSYPINRAEEN